MERMFDKDSFSSLANKADTAAAVAYLAHNELKFRRELVSEGLTYDEVQDTVKELWQALLKQCIKYRYTDYIVESKKRLYN